MKIAIPTRNEKVDNHFGHCEYYTIYDTGDKKNILTKELFRTNNGCGCKSNIAEILQDMEVTVMLAGNIGQGALSKLHAHDIKVLRGCQGMADDLITSYLHGEISDSEIVCEQHECHH